jgi:argininosuccinate lyase
MAEKLWGGRFETGPSEVFERFSGSLQFDKKLLDADCRGSQAFARALDRAGILTADEREHLVTAFEQIRTDARDPKFLEGASDEDVHTFVIRKLKDRVGILADKIHTGRSRNEQVSLDVRLWLREQIDVDLALLADLMGALIEMARKYPHAIVPGYTHLRRAQAVPWSHYLLAYFEMFARDHERLSQARARVDVMPLGSGALAGSGFPFDRDAMARDLGFAAITRNSMDVSGDRDGVTSGSSLMPQKKNPDSLELVRGKSGRVFGDFTSLFVTMKGLPMTYNRDMQEDKEPLFDAAAQLTSSLEMMAAVIESSELHARAPMEAAKNSWVVATDLAEALARAGTPFHRAHQIVGRLVLESIQQGKQPLDWTADQLTAFAPEFTADMAHLLQPTEGMRTRELPGGAGPVAVAKALEDAEARLRHWRHSNRQP